jgi:hypothetical protein
MIPVSHFDLMVLFTVAGCIHFGGILFALWVAFRIIAMEAKSHDLLAECQRLTRAVGALVIQEEEKTRNLFRLAPKEGKSS